MAFECQCPCCEFCCSSSSVLMSLQTFFMLASFALFASLFLLSLFLVLEKLPISLPEDRLICDAAAEAGVQLDDEPGTR